MQALHVVKFTIHSEHGLVHGWQIPPTESFPCGHALLQIPVSRTIGLLQEAHVSIVPAQVLQLELQAVHTFKMSTNPNGQFSTHWELYAAYRFGQLIIHVFPQITYPDTQELHCVVLLLQVIQGDMQFSQIPLILTCVG
jgi:hypothetical protein